MVGARGKGSRSKSKGRGQAAANPEPLTISDEVSPASHSCDQVEENGPKNGESVPQQEEVMDQIISIPEMGDGHEFILGADEVNDVEEDSQIAMNDFISVREDDMDADETDKEKIEEMLDGGVASTDVEDDNNERTDEEDPEEEEEEEEPIECGLGNKDISIWEEQKTPELITGGTTINQVSPASQHGLVESITEHLETEEEPVEDEEPKSRGSSGSEDVNNMEEHNSPPQITGVTNDVEGSLASENGPLESTTENLENSIEANELNAEKRMSTSLDNEGEISVTAKASPVNVIKPVAEKLSRQKKVIRKVTVIKKKQAALKLENAKGQQLDGNGSGESCKPETSNENKLQCLGSDEALGEACKGDETEPVKDEEKMEVKPIVKVTQKRKRLRKKKPQGVSGVEATSDEQIIKPKEDGPKTEENNDATEQEINTEDAEKSKNRINRLKKRKNKAVEEGTQELNIKNTEKPESSKNGKSPKKVDSMGMIFMCSSGTKTDCYKYKVLGLPAAKKNIVSQIYKGMRLFLFDVDLKMLYGIYKAAGPGGYNLEPRAFKSQFPSQVKFTVLEDSLPLAEENFKKIIKDNYYTNNKFNCQLTQDQVKNLCKLFRETTRKAASKRDSGGQRAVAKTSAARDKKRKRAEDGRRLESQKSRRRGREEVRRAPVEVRHAPIVRVREEVRRAPIVRVHEDVRRAPIIRVHEELRHAPVVRYHEEVRHVPVVRHREETRRAPVIMGREDDRRAPAVISERYRHPVIFDREETYLPSLRAVDHHRPRSYSYERSPGVEDSIRRDFASYVDIGLSSSREQRHPVERSHHDPYVVFSEPHPYHQRAYETETRLPVSERYAEHHRSSEYRPPPPLYRRY